MSKVPTIRRLVVEDFPEQKKWIGKLFDLLNTFIINVVQSLSNQLTIGENMLAQIDYARIRTDLNYSEGPSGKGWLSQEFDPSDVDTATDEITLTAHPFSTGTAVQLSAVVLPSGLSAETTYYVIVVDANTIQLAASQADAYSGTFIDLTTIGSGTQSIYNWVSAPPYVGLFEKPSFTIRFKGSPVFVMLGACTEVAGNQIVNTQATTIDWSTQNGLVTINAISGLKLGAQYDVVFYTSGG